MQSSGTPARPDRDAMLIMSDEDFVGLWQQVVGERPAVLIDRGDMIRILDGLHGPEGDGAALRNPVRARGGHPDRPKDGTATPARTGDL